MELSNLETAAQGNRDSFGTSRDAGTATANPAAMDGWSWPSGKLRFQLETAELRTGVPDLLPCRID